MTDIRIVDNRLVPRQSQEQAATPSQSSMKSARRAQDKSRKTGKVRSISSDERLRSMQEKTDLNKKEHHERRSSSPKFLLSLRQLEKLLFSTQQISAQLMKSASAKTTSQAKKQIIATSLKQF